MNFKCHSAFLYHSPLLWDRSEWAIEKYDRGKTVAKGAERPTRMQLHRSGSVFLSVRIDRSFRLPLAHGIQPLHFTHLSTPRWPFHASPINPRWSCVRRRRDVAPTLVYAVVTYPVPFLL